MPTCSNKCLRITAASKAMKFSVAIPSKKPLVMRLAPLSSSSVCRRFKPVAFCLKPSSSRLRAMFTLRKLLKTRSNSGWASSVAIWQSRNCGIQQSSSSRKANTSASASASAWFRAEDLPWFGALNTRIRGSWYVLKTFAVSSVEPSFHTISSHFGKVWASTESTARGSRCARL